MCWVADAKQGVDAARLRRELVDFLHRFGRADGDFAAAELILGELLSNAGRYTPGPVCVSIAWDGEFPRATVYDGGEGFSWAPALPRGHSERGRGLYIISTLARDVQVERGAAGCRVSATLPIPRGRRTLEPSACPIRRPADASGICADPRRRVDAARAAHT